MTPEREIEMLNASHIELIREREIKNEQIANLRAALKDMFALMDEGWLVRDTTHDAEPGWAMKQIQFVGRLQTAQKALTSGLDEMCAACGMAKREHMPGGARWGESSLCGVFIPHEPDGERP